MHVMVSLWSSSPGARSSKGRGRGRHRGGCGNKGMDSIAATIQLASVYLAGGGSSWLQTEFTEARCCLRPSLKSGHPRSAERYQIR